MQESIPNLIKTQQLFIDSKDKILQHWMQYNVPEEILKQHSIEKNTFVMVYASGLFDYIMGIISSKVEIGKCPIMEKLLKYMKDKEITTEELFSICSHFRKSMIDFTYDADINSKDIVNEIYFIFDENFKAILKYYTDTIFQKEQEIDKNVRLMSEYKKALDESALISKTDLEGTITYVNKKLVNLCGYTEDELVGQKYSFMKHEDMSSEYFDNLWKELKHKGIFRGTIKNLKKNGEYFYVDVTIVKINDPFENSTEYMSIAYDITTLIDARAEALNAGKSKEYFLSNMSHEIRTPLNAILGFVNLLRNENTSKKHKKYLDIILNSGENLLSIINDILDFSKLRSGEFTIEPKIFSIHEEISHTMELFVASANNKNITITSFIDPTIPTELYADPLRIKQILSNFLSNAIKFTPDGGIISVEATCEESVLKVRVKDNGIGIAKEDLGNVFTAFAQAQYSENKKVDGTGLGLSICQQLAEHMHGEVTANSALGKGSTFWLKIPVEIKNDSCQIFENIEEFQDLKIVMYSDGKKGLDKYEAFLKYASIFGMDIEVVDSLEIDFDVAVYIHDEIDEEFKNSVIHSDKKYIALMRKLSDEYDKYDHIMPMCFPLYCSKIKATFLELLNPDSYYHQVSKKGKMYTGHILVAEDNEANQELIKIILAKYGLTFDLAYNGLEAVRKYKANSYDLILMDEQMPIMDGNEAVKNILAYEKEESLQHTPVSALTANVIKGVKERGLSSGYDAFLGKPIIIKELEKVFDSYLKVKDESAASDIEAKKEDETSQSQIQGVDVAKLMEELMLSEDELVMLLGLFIKKMKKLLPEISDAIDAKDFKKIALLAHSIKGSSGNFRIESLQQTSSEMESMAKNKNNDYPYREAFEEMHKRIDEIKIS